ncbi:MAG: tRNA dihydrouridine(20/20a) synthase DusA [Candidatus Puniceispirillaceae bacterium]
MTSPNQIKGISADGIDRRLSVAPMMDWTDRHCRFFHRALSLDALLFTEMVTAEAILHAGAERFCEHDATEHPLALQLGGSDPDRLAMAVEAVMPFGFDEINLNVGCPSDRVQSGRFGACLMAEPELVARSMAKMAEASDVTVSVKCRIGIDDMDEEQGLDDFVDAVADSGVDIIYLHARKAWLSGLSPKENRDIPPLNYDRAFRLKQRRPDLQIYLNGGIVTTESAVSEMARFDGVMIGRAAYKTPFILAEIGEKAFGRQPVSRFDVMRKMTDYAAMQVAQGVRMHAMTRHMLGLYNGLPGARLWRRVLGEELRSQTDATKLLHAAEAIESLLAKRQSDTSAA